MLWVKLCEAASGSRADFIWRYSESIRRLLNSGFSVAYSFLAMHFLCFVADELPAEVDEFDCCPLFMSDCALPRSRWWSFRHSANPQAWQDKCGLEQKKQKQIVHLLYSLPTKTSEFQMLCLNVSIRKFIKFIFYFCCDPVCLHSWFQEELCVTKLCICWSHYFIHWTIKAGLASYSWTFISRSKWYFIIFVNWSYLMYTLLDHPVILKGSFLLHTLHFVLQCKKISI